MRSHWKPLTLFVASLLVAPAAAQQDAMHWHQDLESAKVVAKETKRLLLIHFWTPSCGPCMALERNVFNQPGVAAAIEAQFVPVKLNADENSATAQWYGISRVPTDVVATADGQIIAKSVSPPTPAAYVAELSSTANKYAARLGQAYTTAANAAPVQSQLNSAYAKLPVSQNLPAALAPQAAASPQSANVGLPSSATAPPPMFGSPSPAAAASSVPATSPGFPTVPAPTSPVRPAITQSTPTSIPAIPVAQTTPALASPAATYSQPSAQPVPQTVMNPALTARPALAAQPPITTVDTTTAQPSQIGNPYLAAAATATATSTLPLSAARPPMTAQQPALPSHQTQPALSANRAAYAAAPVAPAPISPVTPILTDPAAPVPSGLAATTDSRQLQPGSPPLAFEGYCPVSMRNQWKWVPGNPQYGIVHLGRTYWFAGPEEQKQFWTDPTRYAPAMSGNDPVMAIDHQQQIEGKREHSLDYDGLFYLFASEATLQQFAANPAKYAAGVRQAMGLPRGRLVR